jgi:hypothetical protein
MQIDRIPDDFLQSVFKHDFILTPARAAATETGFDWE